jgi:hypothetical protein
MTNFTNDGHLNAPCYWCGKPAADGERVAIFDASSRFWMHLSCERLYYEEERNDEKALSGLLKFVRRQASGIATTKMRRLDRFEPVAGVTGKHADAHRCR